MIDIKETVLSHIRADDNWGKDDMSIERFHPSTSGYCERQIFLSKINARTFTDIVRGSMQSGTLIHNWVQSFNEIKENFFIEKQVRLNVPDSPIYFLGNSDLVAKDNSLVVDLKSINGLNYVRGTPMTDHIYQVLIYMQGLGIQKGKIIYINKADLDVVEHIIEPSPIRLNKAYEKVKKVYEALKIWDAQPKWDKIPFDKCGCYHCRSEVLEPQFLKLLEGETQ